MLAAIATPVTTSALTLQQVKVDNLVSDVGCNSNSLDVCHEISSLTEKVKVEDPIDLVDDNVSRPYIQYLQKVDRVAKLPLQDARRLHHPVAVAAYSHMHSSMV